MQYDDRSLNKNIHFIGVTNAGGGRAGDSLSSRRNTSSNILLGLRSSVKKCDISLPSSERFDSSQRVCFYGGFQDSHEGSVGEVLFGG
jgi:hypothetical protein